MRYEHGFDDNKIILDSQAETEPHRPVGSGAGGVSEAGTEARVDSQLAPPRSPYLESTEKTVEAEPEPGETVREVKHVVAGQRCQCHFCTRCGSRKGWRLRQLMKQALKLFKHPQMWTLTVDPELFTTAEAQFVYVRKKRCIAEFVKSLRRKGYLSGDHWVAVVEFHKNGRAHYHLVIDAEFIPFEAARDAWNRFRPNWASRVIGRRPGFGSIRFSASDKFQNSEHAAFYITKYLVKHPQLGYPDWVLDFKGNIKRYSVSHGFWKVLGKETEQEMKLEYHDSSPEKKRPRRFKTPRERISACCKEAMVLRIETVAGMGYLKTRTTYLGQSVHSLEQLVRYFLQPKETTLFAVCEYDARVILTSGYRRIDEDPSSRVSGFTIEER